jgi:glycosyltransferase involved in cell wall biosynthesis
MIVRDEEAVLGRCLDSVAGVVDEMIVVDTGSTDATKEIARECGATVLDFDFTEVDFAGARNHGLDHARGELILVLDADETLAAWEPPAGATGYVVTRRNLGHGETRPLWMDHAVRIFPRHPRYRYRHRVHETIDGSILAAGGRIRTSGVVIDHFLPAEEVRRAKGLRYLDLLERDIARTPDDAERLVFLAAEYHKLEMFAEAIAVAERVALLCPDDFTAQITAALYHFVYAGDAETARHDLAQALRLRPDDTEALGLLRVIEAV